MWLLDVALWSLILIMLLPALVVGMVIPWGNDSQRWGDE